MKILYAEDEQLMQDITKEFLELDSIDVDIAGSAIEAIDMLKENHYDALVSDYQMPGMDGIQLLKYLRSRSNNIPFILFTGRGREEIVIEALNSGADYYLQKGGEPRAQYAELAHHIRRAVERRLGEAELAESREKFRSLVECIGDWRWEMDDKGRYTYSSPQCFDVIGYRPEEVVGHSALEYMPESEGARITSIINERLSKEGRVRKLENVRVHRDGRLVMVETVLVPVLGKQGQTHGYRGVDRDITKEKETDRALRDVNHKYMISANITWHDILNQLSVLDGNIELLRSEGRSGSMDLYLRRIETASRSVRKHIEFSRDYQMTGQQRPEWQNVFRSFMAARSMVDTRDVIVECSVSDLEVMADPMLVKAFFNMIDNSLRYGEKVTRVRLTAFMSDDQLVLCYEDNGNGVQDRERERLFEKGFGRNTGLGMFLIRSILSITDIGIEEKGRPGEGIRLEMRVPTNRFRFSINRTMDNVMTYVPEDQADKSPEGATGGREAFKAVLDGPVVR